MSFIADFHVHSRFSRATSKNLNFEQLDYWGRIKGVALIGTGDFTHPQWRKEIEEKLIPCGDGLFTLKREHSIPCAALASGGPLSQVRFMITGEISNIYKYAGKTRKVHNIICMPSLDAASRFTRKLENIGNIRSDGRPILGLDSRHMLEILLEVSPQAALIPAHIWTPWFSVLGSKSGFDSIEDCYRDLSGHVFAVETGLSSNPRMNWMVSKLDRYSLVSNSDAHSAPNIGREANLFECEMGYAGIMDSLKARDGNRFLGTIEVFPEEGKYHYDGHRKCGVCLSPEKSRECERICPACGKLLTIGVLYRVLQLADRPEGVPPENPLPFKSVLSLETILAEIQGTKTAGVKVKKAYRRLIHNLGPELNIILDLPLEVIQKQGSEPLAEAVRRIRKGSVKRQPGFDGQYGVISLFNKNEARYFN